MDNQVENNDLNELTLQYAKRIKEFQMKPKTRVFIISSKFVKGLESFEETKKVPKVQNAELKNAFNSMSANINTNKNKKKNKSKSQKNKNLQIIKDYYPVDENLWNDIVFHFGGGPEISYYVCEDGSIDLANFQIMVKCGTEKKCIQTSMKTDLQTFHLLVLEAFGYDLNDKYKLCANNSPTPISTEGTVGGKIANEKLLILTIHYPEKEEKAEKSSKEKPKVNTAPAKIETKTVNENKTNEPFRPLGLKNTGNSCYMNSVIQCFASVDPLNRSLNLLLNEANATVEALNRLGEKENLRGLSAKLHYGQFKTTSSFISLMSNLKNNIPEKNNDYTFSKPAQNKKGGRRYKNQKYTKSYTNTKIQTAIHVKKTMSLFANNQQQDAHEFFSFLLDAVHDECPKTIEKLFYGKCKRTTTCALCGHESAIVEDFSSLPLPISMSRKVLFSPYDLSKPLQRIPSIPENLKEKVILIGKTRKGKNEITTKMSPDFIEVIALEIPDLSNPSQSPASNSTIDEIAIISTESKFSNVENIDGNDVENEVDDENDSDNENDNKFANLNDDNNENDTNNENEENKEDNENKEENKNNENKENPENNKEKENKKNQENKEENANKENKEENANKENKEENESNKNLENNENKENKEENKEVNENNNNKDSNENENKDESKSNIDDVEKSENLNLEETQSQIEIPKDVEYGIALLRVINKKLNEKTLPLLLKVPLNIQLSEEQISEIVKERLASILEQPDSQIKLLAPPKIFEKNKDKPLCKWPVGCEISCPMKPTRLETIFTKSEIPISVDELLDSFFSKMQLDEDNMWLCEVCKNNSCAYQQVHLLDTKINDDEKMNQIGSDQIEATNENNELNNQQKETANNENNEQQKETTNNENNEEQKETTNNENNEQQKETTNNENPEKSETDSSNAMKQSETANENVTNTETTTKDENNDHNETETEPEKDQLNQNNNNESPENQDNNNNNNNDDDNTNNDHSNSSKPDKNRFHLPRCMVLQLKRFLSKNGRLAKDPTTVIVPHYINFSRFIEYIDPDSNETETKVEDSNDKKYLYKLSAVSNHAGSLQGGHYTAYGERNGSWYTFNDSVVSANNNIFNAKSNDYFGSSNAYLLFYSKVED